MKKIVINNNDAGQRLDKFVSKATFDMPQSLLYKYIRKKRVKVNGKKADISQRLETGDVVELYIPDEFFRKSAETDELAHVKTDLSIIYEDGNIIICDKAPGILVHADDNGGEGTAARDTLIFRIQAYLYQKGEYIPASESSFAPALCNRIDRNTGGIVIAAKNAEALRSMNELIKNGGVDKTYLCAVHGAPCPENATLHGFLFKNTKTKTVTVTDSAIRGSKEITTRYKTLAYNGGYDLALLEVKLITGRTHQIRAHLSYIDHPLLGEGKYSHNRNDRSLGYSHQALYAYKISFSAADGALAYLNGRTFTTGLDNIRFLELFPAVRIKDLAT